MKKIQRIMRNQFLVWIILVIGTFLLSAQEMNIANATGLDDSWTQYYIDDATTPTAPRAVFAIDIDCDGDIDVVSANSDWNIDNKIVWYENLGGSPPSWAEHVISTLQSQTYLTDVFAIDLDGDNDADVISAAMGGDALAWYENLGCPSLSWTTHVIPITAASGISNTVPYSKGQNVGPSVFAIDINHDQRIDILWGNGRQLGWYENLGGSPPSWSEKHSIPNTLWESAPGTSVFAIDIYNDGDIDVIAGTSGSNSKLAWYENLGGSSPNWVEHGIDSSSIGGFIDVFAIDLDKDGDIDVLAGSYWYENNGNHPPLWFEHNIGALGTDVFAADLDNDCDIDVIGTSPSTGRINWYENLGGSPPAWIGNFIGYGSWIFPVDMYRNGTRDIVAGLEELESGIYYGEILWFENPFPPFLRGDANADGLIDVGDVIYLINCLYKNGPCPNPLQAGDANCDCVVDVGDVVYLINYLFKRGPAPSC